jgi:hypothetical protein
VEEPGRTTRQLRLRLAWTFATLTLVTAVTGCHERSDGKSVPVPGMHPRGAVEGYVRDQNGRPIAGAIWGVMFLPPNTLVEHRGVVSYVDGRYVSVPLPPGRYLTEVAHEGYETRKKWVTIRAGEASRVDFTLRRK